jgi:hypothetical protein
MGRWFGRFRIDCLACGKRRGLLHGILICPVCDYSHEGASVIPNEDQVKDIPE